VADKEYWGGLILPFGKADQFPVPSLRLCGAPRSSGHDANIPSLMISFPDRNDQGDGRDWLSFTGEIDVGPEVTIGGFKAAGLWVKVRPPAFFFALFFFVDAYLRRTASSSRLRLQTRARAQLAICVAPFLFG